MISGRQRAEFAERGLVRIDKLIPEATVAPVRELALKTLEQEGVWRDGAWVGGGSTDWKLQGKLLRRLKHAMKHSAAYKKLETPGLHEAVALLVDGRATRAMTNRPQVLFTAPHETTWRIPHKIWHMDVPRLGEVDLAREDIGPA